MARMNLTLAGVTFTDLALSDVGSAAFRLAHDYFTKQDLVVRTAAAGGGTLLAEGTDFALGCEDTYLSTQVTAVVGAGRNVFLTITVTNVTYQTGALYFSGKYIGDAVEGQATIAASADYTLADRAHDACVDMTAGATEKDVVLGPVAANLDREVDVWKVDSGAGEVKLVANGTEKFLWRGQEFANLYVGLEDQHVKVRATSAGWRIVCGTVQLVAGEPSMGGTHPTSYANRSATLVVDTSTNTAGTWSAAVTMPKVPAGARIAWCMANCYKAAATPILAVEAASGCTLDDITAGAANRKYIHLTSSVAGSGQWGLIKIHLDAAGQFKWCTSVSSSTVQICSPIDYE